MLVTDRQHFQFRYFLILKMTSLEERLKRWSMTDSIFIFVIF